MPRPKESKAQQETAELMISVEDFARTRDSHMEPNSSPTHAHFLSTDARRICVGLEYWSRQLCKLARTIPLVLTQFRVHPNPQFFVQVVAGLTTLQTAVSDLLRSYLKHTNSVLGSTPFRLDAFDMSNPFSNEEPLPGPWNDSLNAVRLAVEGAKRGRKPKSDKEKKAKKPRDPDEPKRPLTVFLLYSQHARDIVRADMGPDVSGGKVEEEIQKRWHALSDKERQGWKQLYQSQLSDYRDQKAVHDAFKKGALQNGHTPVHDAVPDDSAVKNEAAAAAAAAATTTTTTTTTTGTDSEESSSTGTESDEEESSSPKAPSPPVEKPSPKVKRRKTGKNREDVAAPSAAAPAQTTSPVPIPSHHKKANGDTPISKHKSRKRPESNEPSKTTLKVDPVEADELPLKRRSRKAKEDRETAATEPEKKKRKRKSEAGTD